MNAKHLEMITTELSLKLFQVHATIELLKDDATVPFISRYRKEATGSLDEVQVTAIRDRMVQLEELDKRREAIIGSLQERELLTDELKAKVDNAATMTELEDIYLPYRPKRRTRATIAKEKGLEPLALQIFEQSDTFDLEKISAEFISDEKGVACAEDAIAGARDIIAEWVTENQPAREKMRELFIGKAEIKSKVVKDKEEEGAKYRDYFEFEEISAKSPSHRILAMFRGENEGFLKLDIQPSEEEALLILNSLFVKGDNTSAKEVKLAVDDSYKRLLSSSMETELRQILKKKADEEAIRVFAENLKQLLLAPPLGEKNLLALDPGFRTGCKVVCLDKHGKLLYNDAIYPHSGEGQKVKAAETLRALCKQYKIEAIAIGNGTAGRETEAFVREAELSKDIITVMVNESGASIYSASEVARKEFPDCDLTVRGSVSIGRRLMDPLAELVKIDPKSIGVGQYQHDVDQNMLKGSLDDVVISCVNNVGVEINSASRELLSYVSGLNTTIAKNIVEYRDNNGAFKTRKQLTKVSRLGPKAFEQSAGFLRIRDAANPLDASAVHPESYHIVEKMAEDLNCAVKDLMKDASLRQKIELEKYITDKVGMPTLQDIIQELAKPGRDPRKQFEVFKFSDDVHEIKDLQVGMELPGVVTNITAFGAFVDIGVHQDGLVHVSEITDQFIKNPAEALDVQQKVTVKVMEVDIQRKRISLSMKGIPNQIKKIESARYVRPSTDEGIRKGGDYRKPEQRSGDSRPGGQNHPGAPGGNAQRSGDQRHGGFNKPDFKKPEQRPREFKNTIDFSNLLTPKFDKPKKK